MAFSRAIKTRRKARRKRSRNAPTSLLTLSFASLFLLLLLLFASRTKACTYEPEPLAGQKVIGIHLGASESRVGIVQNKQITILHTPENKSSILSYVAATHTGLVAGEEAKRTGGLNLFKAVLDMKTYFDENTGANSSFSPPGGIYSYTLQNNHQVLKVNYNKTCHSFTPEEIYAPLLAELHSIAKHHIGTDIAAAVVAIPLSYNDLAMAELERAGLHIGLPIERRMRESTSVAVALGLDNLSYDGDRYALLFDLSDDYDTLTTSLVEIDTGLVDTLAVHRERGIARKIYDKTFPTLERERAFTNGTDPVSATMESLTPYTEHHLEETLPWAVTHVLRKAEREHNDITDMIFSPSMRSFPSVQKRMIDWFTVLGVSNLRIANAESLKEAPVWGATFIARALADEETWTPCSCKTYRPPIGIGTSDGDGDGFIEVVQPCYSLPLWRTRTFRASCGYTNHNKTAIQVYMRDLPTIDYHAMMELGDLYTPDESRGDVLLGEFDLPTPCINGAEPPLLEISMFISRGSVLKIQAVNKQSGESATMTIPEPAFECGQEGRFEGRNFTLSRGVGMEREEGKNLWSEYGASFREFIRQGGIEEPVDVFDEKLFARWVDDNV